MELTTRPPQDLIVEFRQGDEIPITFSSQGDLLETVLTGVSYIKVKRTFWLQIQNDHVQISMDGSHFHELKKIITGSFMVGASGPTPNAPVNAINLALKAFLK